MSWQQLISDSHTAVAYYWFPGWSFAPTVFSPLYQQMPGHHWGMHYPATRSFADAVAILSTSLLRTLERPTLSPRHIVLIGWSLGGALATHCLQQLQIKQSIPVHLITLATGQRFLQSDADSGGMAQHTFNHFAQQLHAEPHKTLRRFLALCSQHAAAPRALIQQLSPHQLAPSTIVYNTLTWLSYAALTDTPMHNSCHLYAQHDALSSQPLPQGIILPLTSHAFFLTAEGAVDLHPYLALNTPAK